MRKGILGAALIALSVLSACNMGSPLPGETEGAPLARLASWAVGNPGEWKASALPVTATDEGYDVRIAAERNEGSWSVSAYQGDELVGTDEIPVSSLLTLSFISFGLRSDGMSRDITLGASSVTADGKKKGALSGWITREDEEKGLSGAMESSGHEIRRPDLENALTAQEMASESESGSEGDAEIPSEGQESPENGYINGRDPVLLEETGDGVMLLSRAIGAVDDPDDMIGSWQTASASPFAEAEDSLQASAELMFDPVSFNDEGFAVIFRALFSDADGNLYPVSIAAGDRTVFGGEA